MDYIRLGKLVAVEEQLLIFQMETVAGDAHSALYVSLADIDGIAEDDDVAAFDFTVGKQRASQLAGWGVSKFIDQQMVAHQQSVFHRAGRNNKGLNQRGGSEQQQDYGDGPLRNDPARLGFA